MKKKLQLLGVSVILGAFSITAQTTHNIDWTMGVGGAASITIEVGDEIIWTNTEAISHNVVSSHVNAPANFGSGTMANGDTYAFTFNDPVQFTYECSFHPATMGGVITVVENLNCTQPSDVGVTNVTSTSAEFFWVTSPDETDGYMWVVMNSGDDPLTDTPVDNGNEATGATSAITISLTADTEYDFYVEARCGNDGTSGYAGPVTFTTETLSLSQNKLEGFKFYPNPATELVNIEAQERLESVVIYNMMSQKVIDYLPVDNTYAFELNISHLEKGSYFIKVRSGNEIGMYKLVKK